MDADERLLKRAIEVAELAGIRVLREALDGIGGGIHRVAGGNWLVVDRQLPASEQLRQIRDTLSVASGVQVPQPLWRSVFPAPPSRAA